MMRTSRRLADGRSPTFRDKSHAYVAVPRVHIRPAPAGVVPDPGVGRTRPIGPRAQPGSLDPAPDDRAPARRNGEVADISASGGETRAKRPDCVRGAFAEG